MIFAKSLDGDQTKLLGKILVWFDAKFSML